MQPWDGEASLAQRSGGAGLGRGSCPATVSLHCWPTEAENLRPGRHSLTPSRRLPLHVAARYGHTEAVVVRSFMGKLRALPVVAFPPGWLWG